jgi:uncharacterized membrane protein
VEPALSEHESASPRSKLRIENLSDLVFGLALSIGSITLISKLPQTPSDLVTNIVLFAFSFLIVIWVWTGYTRTMSALPFEVRGAFVLNIALLFCVAIEPYLFYVLDQSAIGLLDFASSIYALDTGAMMFLLAGLVYMVRHAKHDSLPHGTSSDQLERLRRVMFAEIFSGAVFFASTLPLFWLPVQFGSFLRFDLWYGSFILFFGIIRVPVGRKPPG